jgi:DNA-binding HxlR family transcriptional regulator
VAVLHALSGGACPLSELRRSAGSPAQTTLRALLRQLGAIGATERHRLDRFPSSVQYELTPAGADLTRVLATLEHWLALAPQDPPPPGSAPARSAIKALAEAWSTLILRAIAARPLSLTELDGVIASLSYPAIERRLAAMRLVGQIETAASDNRRTPYEVTDWLRAGVAPLIAAARWERLHLPDVTPPFGRIDFEAALLLASPLVRLLDSSSSGTCRIAASTDGEQRRLAGATICVDAKGSVSGVAPTEVDVDAWAIGPTGALLTALVEGDLTGLQIGGDRRLAQSLLQEIHSSLFGVVSDASAA